MRTTIAWSAALFALVEIVPTSWGSPISRTENTEPCAVIHALQELWSAAKNETKPLEIDATLASQCLRSVPLNVTDELVKLEEIGKYLQFQSTIEWAANPPKTGLYREPVNLMSGLEEIKAKVRAEEYEGAYQVAEAIRRLLRKVRDGHLKWKSPCLEGSFSFFHKFPIIHLWDETGGFGKIYAANDFMDREELKKGIISQSPNNTKPVSAISTIAGEPAFDYLERFVEHEAGSFHDPDARWNSLFAARQDGSLTMGAFATSSLIPEPLSFEIGFENGTSRTIDWKATVVGNFVNTTSGSEYYQNHCTAFEPIVAQKEEEETAISIQEPPSIFENVTERVPGYPIPLAKAHNNMLSSYLLHHPSSPTTLTGVLAIHTFLALNESAKFSDFVIDTLNTFHQLNVSNLIIDVSGNGGGNVALGYSTFAQLFPQLNPSATTNMRAHPFAEFLASDAAITLQALSSNPSTTPEELEYAVSTPFCFAPQQSLSGGSFPDWRSAYGPIDIRGDNYTNYMRWNLDAPEFNITHSDAGQRWDASQIVVLGDGMCSSTCTLFVSAMVNAGVRTVAYGGRPNRGTMQIIGGVEGSQVLTFEELWSLGESAVQNAVWREYANTNATTNSTTSTNATSSSPTANPTTTKRKLTNLQEHLQESRPQKRSSSPTSSFAPELPTSLESILPHIPTRKLRGNGVVNLRNAFDAHWDVPREFVYRASDYRVPVTAEEWADVERLWRRVVGEVWYV